mmetsp:Transcript_233/g.581  ORF Transcript_233/g.581 Transcript_233/m.581 type:complete len:226 (+) Transcript_233:667-1344(+)
MTSLATSLESRDADGGWHESTRSEKRCTRRRCFLSSAKASRVMRCASAEYWTAAPRRRRASFCTAHATVDSRLLGSMHCASRVRPLTSAGLSSMSRAAPSTTSSPALYISSCSLRKLAPPIIASIPSSMFIRPLRQMSVAFITPYSISERSCFICCSSSSSHSALTPRSMTNSSTHWIGCVRSIAPSSCSLGALGSTCTTRIQASGSLCVSPRSRSACSLATFWL